ncbi:uncharacterized protein LOC144754265 isoform X2 [Lissotriton helveticus]
MRTMMTNKHCLNPTLQELQYQQMADTDGKRSHATTFKVLHLALDRHDGLSLHPLDLHHAPLQATEHTGTLHTCSYTAFSEPAASGNITGHLCTGLQCASATFTRQECIVCDWRTDEPGATSVFSFGLLPTGEKLP